MLSRTEQVELPRLAKPRRRDLHLPAVWTGRIDSIVGAMALLSAPDGHRSGGKEAEKSQHARPGQDRHAVKADVRRAVGLPAMGEKADVMFLHELVHDLEGRTLSAASAVQLRRHHRNPEPCGRCLRGMLKYFRWRRCHGTLFPADGHELVCLLELWPLVDHSEAGRVHCAG